MIDLPVNDPLSKSANRKVRKLLGRAYLHEDRLEEALEVYLGLLADDADDSYVLTVLGNLYRLAGSLETAGRLYERALALDPGNLLIRRQAAQAEEAGMGREDEAEPLSLPAVMRLAQRLRGEAGLFRGDAGPGLWVEIRAAADMLEKFIPEEKGGASAGSVQQLMPALIEMNIRHARAAGRTDIAEALQSLQIHLRQQAGE
jgi:tetratricopeptide (TPR) repeat protein